MFSRLRIGACRDLLDLEAWERSGSKSLWLCEPDRSGSAGLEWSVFWTEFRLVIALMSHFRFLLVSSFS